ncbi:hypothetical protein HanIR_Chr02g0052341 [Helianthus annuus]|nr:hypothetical protein HanIR_Chr02g0052341 [Helianthus annuus]
MLHKINTNTATDVVRYGTVWYRNNMMYLYKKNNEKCFQQKLYHNVFILVEC